MGTLVFYLFHELAYGFRDKTKSENILDWHNQRKTMKLIKEYIAISFIQMLNGKQRILGMCIWNASYLVAEFSVGAVKN
jgi:hypothetical protein